MSELEECLTGIGIGAATEVVVAAVGGAVVAGIRSGLDLASSVMISFLIISTWTRQLTRKGSISLCSGKFW